MVNADLTPSAFLQETYRLMRMHACEDVRRAEHVPPILTGVVVSPHNPPELHVYAMLDGRQAPLQMRAIVREDPAVFGFVYVTVGTVLHEHVDAAPTVEAALLCLWCHASAAGGESFRIRPAMPFNGVSGNILDQPEPLPVALRDLYTSVFDLSALLPGILSSTPH